MHTITKSLMALMPDAQTESRPDGDWITAGQVDVTALARHMTVVEAPLSTITAIARPDGETDLIYHYHQGSEAVNIKTITRANSIASITPVCPAANWIEREIHDLYAVDFPGHPNLERLIRPPELAAGFFREPGGKAAKKP